jgi:UDP-N-acetylmuramoyl-tripeptide--D-alanyl-D-alanine ligase
MKEILWSKTEVIKAAQGQAEGLNWESTGVSIDTRTLQEGDLYIALRGDQMDGHRFVAEAFRKGAVSAIVDQMLPDYEHLKSSLIIVKDTFKALQDLGAYARMRLKGRVIGVTGSAGKTTTKEMLKLAFGTKGLTYASSKSFNNHWGVPYSLAECPQKSQYAIFEMGMNHEGELQKLTEIVHPHISIITTIAPAHLEYFGSLEKIAEAKAEIFKGMDVHGKVIINGDLDQTQQLKDLAIQQGIKDIYTFGENPGVDAQLIGYEVQGNEAHITVQILGKPLTYALTALGKHMAFNSLAVLLAAHLEGLSLSVAANALCQFHALAGRGQVLKLPYKNGTITVLDESYNANPASMQAAFEKIGGMSLEGKRFAILGDMGELGSLAPKMHEFLREHIEKNKIKKVYVCGPLMKYLYEALPQELKGHYCPEKKCEELVPYIKKDLQPGDAVLIKGSNFMKMWETIPLLEAHN